MACMKMNVFLVTAHTLILCLSPNPVFSERMYYHPSCYSGRNLEVISSTFCSLSQYLIYQQSFQSYPQVCPNSEKAMAPYSSTLAWKIPWMEEPGRLQSMGSLRVGHDLVSSLSLFSFMHWRRKWQPTPVFLPGESQKQGSLVGCQLWGCTESDTTEAT